MSAPPVRDGPDRGLWIFRGSRLEGLLDPLTTLLAASPPTQLLAPAELVAAHPGMRRWLLNQLAAQAGARGIAANLRIDLPGQWLERCVRERLGSVPGAGWQAGALRWRLHELLREVETGRGGPQDWAAYLAVADDGRRRLQLANALAALYGRLLVYRADWLQAWDAGVDSLPEPTALAALWRQLRAAIAQPHRGELLERLIADANPTPASAAAPLHVFGLSHLPPRLLDALVAESRRRVVALYLPDPCAEHWAGLGRRSQRLRSLLDAPADVDPTSLYLDIGHPLLAGLGRIGQDFGVLIARHDREAAVDLRDWRDQDEAGDRRHLLGRVQDSVRRLDPRLIAADADALAADADRSLRVHRCHSRLRELEVLRDALWQAMQDDPGLRPADIAVLAADMPAYAPLLGGVFGAAGRADTPLPYHVADLPRTHANPVFGGFLALLDSPRQRLSPKSLVALLDVAAVRRAFGLDAAALDDLERWLRESAVGWGLDAQSRRDESLPVLDSHDFAWGMDRLLCGYLLGEDAGAALVDGIAPAAAIRDTEAATLGALDRLLLELAALRARARSEHPLSDWLDHAGALAVRCLRAESVDSVEQDSIEQLLAVLGELRSEADAAGCDPQLSHVQFCDCLREALAAVPERTPFLYGGATFCGMVPQRALPFRFIAVLGLEEGAFPRHPTAVQFDPLPRHPRIGDRDVTADDRYLFLETLMAARGQLHLSWIGEGARDGRARNPAAPLSSLLELLDQTHGIDAETAPPERPWLLRHPLQPHSSPAVASAPAALIEAVSAPLPSISPAALLRWLRDPARELLRDRLRVRLDALDEQALAEQEPLDGELDARRALWRELLVEALASGAVDIDATPSAALRASGLLPPGRLGIAAYARERDLAQSLLGPSRQLEPFADGLPARLATTVSWRIGGHEIRGSIDGLFPAAGGLWLVEWAKSGAHAQRLSTRLMLLLRWALLRLADPQGDQALRIALVSPDEVDPWSLALDALDTSIRRHAPASLATVLGERVERILGAYLGAATRPTLWLPRSSEAWLNGKDVASAWQGDRRGSAGERDYVPGYAALAVGDRSFWREDDPDFELFAATARGFAEAVDPAELAQALALPL